MNIDCRQLPELLFEYFSDEMSPERRQLLEEHLKACPPCYVYKETYRITITLSRKLPCRELSPECKQRLREALARLCPEHFGESRS